MNIDRNLHRAENPLVSVVVVTYNSATTVIETLDSIKEQTYQNIELIVSDDYSSDDTIKVVKKWMEKYSSRFMYSEIVSAIKNTGVAGNLNRGIRKSHGAWIKTIAGDDLLTSKAIEEYISYISLNAEIRMCVCDVEPFAIGCEVPESILHSYKSFFEMESESYEQQRKRVMTSLVFVGPTYFFSRELFDEIGGYSEKYSNAEEWPFVYKVITKGNRIYALNKKLVLYRFRADSLCHSRKDNGLVNYCHFIGLYKHYFDYPFKTLIKEGHFLTAWDYALYFWSRKLQYRIKNKGINKVVVPLFFLFSPLAYLRKLGICKAK